MNESITTNILLVDDEPSIRGSFRNYLEDYGYNVVTADSAEEALSLMDEMPFDITIVDLRLPEMSGEALILKAYELSPEMKFLIHTGSADYKLSDELKKIGIRTEYIYYKPLIDMYQLVKGIESLLHGRKGNDV